MSDESSAEKREMETDSEKVDTSVCSGEFNGGYIEASQEAYDLLIAYGVKERWFKFGYTGRSRDMNKTFLLVYDNEFAGDESEISNSLSFKQFYINNGNLSWDRPTKLKQICDNPDVNSMEDLNELPFTITEKDEEALPAAFIEKLAHAISENPKIIFASKVHEITNALAEMLISKNAKYGNSALEPKRIFSKADAI